MVITDLSVLDLRFPTSRTHAGTDAVHVDPDYSAAYVVLKTDAGLEGHGLAIEERIPLQTEPTPENIAYLRVKQEKLGHLLDVPHAADRVHKLGSAADHESVIEVPDTTEEVAPDPSGERT